MNFTETQEPEAAGPKLGLHDIVFVLLRHKWKILLLSLLGFAAAVAVHRLWPETVYRSEAKLFIRYLQETKLPGSVGDDARIMSPDQRGETIMSSELEILTSMDLARQVASRVGPERVLLAVNGGNDLDAAAGVIRSGLIASASRGSRVVKLAFEHPESELVQPVLRAIIDEYLKKHVEIHRTAGIHDDFLSKETLLLRSRLAQTEEDLRKVKDQAGIISIDESKRAYAEQMSKVRQQIFDSSAELAERKAVHEQFSEPVPEAEKVPVEKVREYRNVAVLLDTLVKQEQDLLYSYHPETTMVRGVRKRISESEQTKASLEQQYPSLAAKANADNNPRPIDDRAVIKSLETRIAVLQQHLERIRIEASELSGIELSIADLQRRKELQEQHYRYFSASLEQARINEALGSGTVSNISMIQTPTPAVSDVGKLYKVVGALAGSGVMAGLALAFGIELFVDRSFKRPREIRNAIGLPLFLSIPRVSLRLRSRFRPDQPALPAPADSASITHVKGTAPLKPGQGLQHPIASVDHPLQPYFESLRNQLVQDFEVRKLGHIPKLVGVTSCDSESGVSTIAIGLANSLSQSGEGKVLLVDMNPNQGAQELLRNGSRCDLAQVLEPSAAVTAQIGERLYMASTTDHKSQVLPRRFATLIPKVKESEYEYVVFDMPPVHQLTATAQFARYMDSMLVVVEAEKTNRDMVKEVAATLRGACDNVGVVLNKTRNYLPRQMLQEV